jgi:hypothetical protein
MNKQVEQLEATPMQGGQYVVRPVGQLGTMGWSPRAWDAVWITAKTEREAIRKANGKVFCDGK